jgi:sigma-B regulation protein RsbU (phosphoserine phosphatase)
MTAADDDTDEPYELAPCGLLTTTAEGAIVGVNRTLCRWLGRASNELIGMRFQDLLTIGSKLFHQTHWMPLLELQGSVAEVQFELVLANEKSLPVLVNAARRAVSPAASKEGGETRGLIDIAAFVAADRRKYERELLLARRRAEELLASGLEAQEARARAEARLRLALDSAELRVWDADVATGVRSYERSVASLIGRPASEPVSAEAYAACMRPEDLAADASAFAAALDTTSRATYSLEYPLLGHDGATRIVHSTGRAFFDAAGKPVSFSGVLDDVTALRQQEREAKQRAEVAEQLIGIVSHDLRNPLNAVLLGVHLLSTPAPGNHERVVTRIASAANRANRLVGDLLDFTQARIGGGLRVGRTELALHEVVAECIDELKLAWPGRMIEHVRVGEGIGTGDPDRIAQVVANLGNNALTYGSPNEPIAITSVIGDHLEIRVHNAGAPIPEELKAKIFEPMRRGEHQVKLGSRSVGLGLYIVREIATAHGGHVAIESNASAGTTFIVKLPGSARALGPGEVPT